MVETKIIS